MLAARHQRMIFSVVSKHLCQLGAFLLQVGADRSQEFVRCGFGKQGKHIAERRPSQPRGFLECGADDPSRPFSRAGQFAAGPKPEPRIAVVSLMPRRRRALALGSDVPLMEALRRSSADRLERLVLLAQDLNRDRLERTQQVIGNLLSDQRPRVFRRDQPPSTFDARQWRHPRPASADSQRSGVRRTVGPTSAKARRDRLHSHRPTLRSRSIGMKSANSSFEHQLGNCGLGIVDM